MKVSSSIIGLIVGVVLGFLFARLFFAKKVLPYPVRLQTGSTDTAQWQWADSLDAVKAAPNSHKVLFENNQIRLLEVVLKPHTLEPMHTHRYPGVMFGNNNGDTSQFDIVYYRYGFDSSRHQYFVKDSIHQHSDGNDTTTDAANYLQPEGPHRIKNLSNVTIDVYRVEFKGAENNSFLK